MQSNMFAQKTTLRKLMKEAIKNIGMEEKERQSAAVVNYLINHCKRFKEANHVAVYLAMKQEEIDTIPLIEKVLLSNENSETASFKHLYVPHVEMTKNNEDKSPEMCFFELSSIKQYKNDMNDNNKYKLKQFNDPCKQIKANEQLFDLIIVPGLSFDENRSETSAKQISRLGRGKGYYDVFLSKIPNCHTIGIGFNEQFMPLNPSLSNQTVPVIQGKDVFLNEFICEKLIQNNEI